MSDSPVPPRKRPPAGATAKRRRGPSVTRTEVARTVLEWIIDGRYAPGERLPAQSKLREAIGKNLSMSTLSAGLAMLEDLGFLEILPQRYTAVADPLPFRNRFVMTFPRELDPRFKTSYSAALRRVAEEICRRDPGLEFVYLYETIRGEHIQDSLRALEEDLKWHRVAGIILTAQIYRSRSVLTQPGIPRVALGGWSSRLPPVKQVEGPAGASPGSFIFRALSRARDRGCRSVALMAFGLELGLGTVRYGESDTFRGYQASLEEFGLTTRPEWQLCLHAGGWEVGRLLMAGRERPDAVILTDDTLVSPVTSGIAAAGVQPPLVLGLANFPLIPEAAMPVEFFGPDVEALMRWAMDYLRSRDQGNLDEVHLLKALSEAEWRAAGGRPIDPSSGV